MSECAGSSYSQMGEGWCSRKIRHQGYGFVSQLPYSTVSRHQKTEGTKKQAILLHNRKPQSISKRMALLFELE